MLTRTIISSLFVEEKLTSFQFFHLVFYNGHPSPLFLFNVHQYFFQIKKGSECVSEIKLLHYVVSTSIVNE